MRPQSPYDNQESSFWADVRQISQSVGYTQRAAKAKAAIPATRGKAAVTEVVARDAQIKVPLPSEIQATYTRLGIEWGHLFDAVTLNPTTRGKLLLDYFAYRAEVLNKVKSQLMDKVEAESEYLLMRNNPETNYPENLFPKNKQGEEKKKPAYLTGMVNMLLSSNLPKDFSINYNPQALTLVTDKDQRPIHTMARRVDGAFPGAVNPVAIWEIKEYYHTTTFGSRVADGVYETMLDGMEIQQMSKAEGRHIYHYLIADARETWWDKGRSYMCRMVDILNMGLVDEVLLGREIFDRLPKLLEMWIEEAKKTDTKFKQEDITPIEGSIEE